MNENKIREKIDNDLWKVFRMQDLTPSMRDALVDFVSKQVYKQTNKLKKQLEDKEKELSELKAKHKEDVMNAFNDGKRADIYTRQDFENGKEYTYTTPEQYYTQTHGQ